MSKNVIIFFVILLNIGSFAKDNIPNSKFYIGNGLIEKVVDLKNDSLISISLLHSEDQENFIRNSKEFSFLLNNHQVDGFSGWKFDSTQDISDENNGIGINLTISSKTITGLTLKLNYLTYPNLPLIRKWITITNNSKNEFKLEKLNIENLHSVFDQIHSIVLHNYSRMKHIGRFVGNWDDPLVVIHDQKHQRGIALGNEAAGILKRTAFHTEGNRNNIEIGMTHPNQSFPFRKWIKPGESFTTPKIFICLYSNRSDAFKVVNEEVNHFVTLHMNPRILQLKEKPTFVYNTWNPFRTFVNDTLMMAVADAAAECGLQEMIIDDGWQINFKGKTSEKDWGGNYGDWLVDTSKFVGGLKPTFDYIKSKGMKPGLWVSIASATKDSRVFKKHPEWFVVDSDGNPGNLHFESKNGNFYSASFGTDWYDYIKNIILELSAKYGLQYAKLDLAIVTSPYVNNDKISGSYATTHPYHKDHEESYYVFYERMLKLFDELHKEAPDLFIDCTFETAGKTHLMDYAIAQHAEGNWLSNFEEASPVGPLRVRQMAWWRTPVMPASSLVIGNLPMDDPNFEFGLKSLIGTLPIVLGDPRKLPKEKRTNIKEWSDWMQEMQQKYDYMSFRKDLSGFGEPQEGSWDGWQRINFRDNTGGIFGIFRHGAKETQRTVFLKNLIVDTNYQIRLAPSGKIIHTSTGNELMYEGLKVIIRNTYDGKIFEVRPVDDL